MDAKQIEGIIRRELDSVDRSELNDALLFGAEDYFQAIRAAAAAVAKKLASKPEPPEPPKTVLPDMSGAKTGRYYWFLAEDGTPVVFFKEYDCDNEPWCVNGFHALSTNKVIVQFPHLGRLHKTGPKEVA